LRLFYGLFCGKIPSVLPHNTLRFAAKYNAFCGKSHAVLRQNAARYAVK
jgi:hypothetical protein